MQTYTSLIDGITDILNHKGRSKKGYNYQSEFIFLLSELKQNYKIELSKKFLFNLFNSNISLKQKRKKIEHLFYKIDVEKRFNNIRSLGFIKYKTSIIEYGFNKWNEPIIKKIRLQNIGKEFINNQKEILTFIKLD